MRYSFVNTDIEVRVLNAVCEYNNGCLGNSIRLVITPFQIDATTHPAQQFISIMMEHQKGQQAQGKRKQ